MTILTENVCQYYKRPSFAIERNEIGMRELHCKQVIAGKFDAECHWAGSLPRNQSSVFIWDASGELFVQMTSSGLSLEFQISDEVFEKQFTVQVGEKTTPLIFYGES